jgi:hypothetical protein
VVRTVKAYSWGTVVLLIVLSAFIVLFSMTMGLANFFSTLMATAHDLLLNTVFFIMSITVIAGALGAFLSEFGVLALLNALLAPLVRILWRLPGSAAIGALTTYISDNPAIIALSKDRHFIEYFEEWQKPALTNFGTSFGMGLVVTAFMMSQGYLAEALIGNAGAIIGSVVSTRIMTYLTRRHLGIGHDSMKNTIQNKTEIRLPRTREIQDGSLFQRVLNSLLEGGKSGLEIGLQIVPGVLVICTMVLMLTFGPGEGGYDGSAYQGIPVIPVVGRIFWVPVKFLFGFSSPDAIAFPVTALGAVGAALALVPNFLAQGLIGGIDIAVFTAIGMCWSGYLSTHVAMMDSLGFRELTGKAIAAHTVGGVVAGVAAHLLVRLIL